MPETSTRHYFGAWICRGSRPGVARFFTATLLRLSLRRGRTENYCPKLQRGTTSVHGFVAATDRALPGFSPRPCFRLSLRRGRTEIHCPKLQRALLSVVAPARPGRNPLPETSARYYFGAWICRSSCPRVARFFTALLPRLSFRRGRTEIHCPKLQRGLASVVAPARRDKKSLPAFSLRSCFGCRSGAAGQKIIARNFNAALLRCMDLSRQLTGRCPVFHRGLAFGCRFGAAGLKSIARNFNALLLRLSLRRGRAETR